MTIRKKERNNNEMRPSRGDSTQRDSLPHTASLLPPPRRSRFKSYFASSFLLLALFSLEKALIASIRSKHTLRPLKQSFGKAGLCLVVRKKSPSNRRQDAFTAQHRLRQQPEAPPRRRWTHPQEVADRSPRWADQTRQSQAQGHE